MPLPLELPRNYAECHAEDPITHEIYLVETPDVIDTSEGPGFARVTQRTYHVVRNEDLGDRRVLTCCGTHSDPGEAFRHLRAYALYRGWTVMEGEYGEE